MKGKEALNYLETDIQELGFMYADLRELYIQRQALLEICDRFMYL